MPTKSKLLGSGNIGSERAFYAARHLKLPSGPRIRVSPATCFLATKMEAIDDRGGDDFLLGKDGEDLAALFGRRVRNRN